MVMIYRTDKFEQKFSLCADLVKALACSCYYSAMLFMVIWFFMCCHYVWWIKLNIYGLPRGMPSSRCTSPKLRKMSRIACDSFWCVLGVRGAATDDVVDDDEDEDEDDDESITHNAHTNTHLNHAQLALVVLCFHNFRLQSCVAKQTTVSNDSPKMARRILRFLKFAIF